jgi:hypothetical protein
MNNEKDNFHNKNHAADNEKKFISLIDSKFNNVLMGKKTFKNKIAGVKISVDNSILYKDKTLLIEIDSGNMAKLLVGQYCLLSQMIDSSKYHFIVIHFYKDYNTERTKKNLDYISKKLNLHLPYSIFHINEISSHISKLKNKNGLVKFLKG